MRAMFLAAGLAGVVLSTAGLSTAAQAAAPHAVSAVSVTIGPELQKKADKYGQRDLDDLAKELKDDVVRALQRKGGLAAGGGELRLVLADATPNHPTFKQLGDTPGLSLQSFGLGGARIEGTLVRPDGTSEPVRYEWKESELWLARTQSTWGDADHTFEMFADRVAHGEQLASR
ncbi:hypothetical protein ACO2Q3_07085 [Caulobacter sp. KR2-114]|uniref:hypothetical protein n=1 Tax=Caulobacter sp. KR2-114 TaxID=3400912 RepID=UPI003C0579B7